MHDLSEPQIGLLENAPCCPILVLLLHPVRIRKDAGRREVSYFIYFILTDKCDKAWNDDLEEIDIVYNARRKGGDIHCV